jgi:hypothetical protein
MLRAAITSAWPAWRHEIQEKVVWLDLFLSSIAPHAGHPLLVYLGSTNSTGMRSRGPAQDVRFLGGRGELDVGDLLHGTRYSSRVEEKQGAAFFCRLKAAQALVGEVSGLVH